MKEDHVPLTPDEAREIITLLGEWANWATTKDDEGQELSKRLEDMADKYAAKLALTLDITLAWYMPFSEDTYRE